MKNNKHDLKDKMGAEQSKGYRNYEDYDESGMKDIESQVDHKNRNSIRKRFSLVLPENDDYHHQAPSTPKRSDSKREQDLLVNLEDLQQKLKQTTQLIQELKEEKSADLVDMLRHVSKHNPNNYIDNLTPSQFSDMFSKLTKTDQEEVMQDILYKYSYLSQANEFKQQMDPVLMFSRYLEGKSESDKINLISEWCRELNKHLPRESKIPISTFYDNIPTKSKKRKVCKAFAAAIYYFYNGFNNSIGWKNAYLLSIGLDKYFAFKAVSNLEFSLKRITIAVFAVGGMLYVNRDLMEMIISMRDPNIIQKTCPPRNVFRNQTPNEYSAMDRIQASSIVNSLPELLYQHLMPTYESMKQLGYFYDFVAPPLKEIFMGMVKVLYNAKETQTAAVYFFGQVNRTLKDAANWIIGVADKTRLAIQNINTNVENLKYISESIIEYMFSIFTWLLKSMRKGLIGFGVDIMSKLVSTLSNSLGKIAGKVLTLLPGNARLEKLQNEANQLGMGDAMTLEDFELLGEGEFGKKLQTLDKTVDTYNPDVSVTTGHDYLSQLNTQMKETFNSIIQN